MSHRVVLPLYLLVVVCATTADPGKWKAGVATPKEAEAQGCQGWLNHTRDTYNSPCAASTPAAVVRLAVTTLLSSPVNNHTSEPSLEYVCQLPLFCQFAKDLQSRASDGLQVDVGVLTARPWNVSRECPGAFPIVPDEEFFHITTQIYSHDNPGYRGDCHLCQVPTARILVIKWFAVNLVEYDLVLMLDLDLDYPHINATTWIAPLLDFHASSSQIAAPSDWAVPINAGSMAFKPNSTTYQRGMSLLRTGLFNQSHGLGHLGPPRSLLGLNESDLKNRLLSRFSINRWYASNTWNVASGSSDQGLFSLFFDTWAWWSEGAMTGQRYVPKHRGAGTYTVSVKHFWAAAKPTLGCVRWVIDLSNATSDASICNSTISHWLRTAGHGCPGKRLVFM